MKLTKEECTYALNDLYGRWLNQDDNAMAIEEDMVTLEQLINEHFDNNLSRTCQNLVSEIDKLEKALDKACGELVTMINAINCWDYESCPFRSMCKEGTNYCHDKEKWKEYLFDETN